MLLGFIPYPAQYGWGWLEAGEGKGTSESGPGHVGAVEEGTVLPWFNKRLLVSQPNERHQTRVKQG